MKLPVFPDLGLRRGGACSPVMVSGATRLEHPIERAVQSLNDRELRMLTESVPIRIAVVDCEQRYRFSNLAHRQSWAGDGSQIIGKTMAEVLGAENYESARPYVERALKGEEVTFEMTVSYKSTEPRFVRINYLPQFDMDGQVTGCLILALDITERRLSEEALRQSEARFGRLVEHTPVIPWEMDISSQLFTFVGHRAIEILGHPISEWMKPKFRTRHLHPEDRRRVLQEFDQIVAEGEDFETEYRLIHQDGSIVWLRDLISVIKRNGEVIALQGLLVDVTLAKEADIERRKLEERLREFQKMQALGTLAGGIAHDFNNILGGIVGYTELALSMLHNPQQARTYLDRILESSYRARELVKQILSFSRGRELARENILLNSIVEEVLQLLRASIPADIRVELADSPEMLAVSVNSTQIHQVILNICTNAAHAMRGDGGTLTIELSRVPVDQLLSRQVPDLTVQDYALLKICDTGHGMSPEVMERIFEPYFTTKPAGEGSGLGLAVAHGIIANHGGVISVQSELGQGSCFEIFLPIKDEVPEAKPQGENPQHPLDASQETQGRIVLVDDEASLVEIGRDMLQHLGCDVAGFTSSLEAAAYIEKHIDQIDLVITDQTMPDLTGDSLIKRFKKLRPDLPVILCTGYSALIDRAGAERLGVNSFLSKPYSIVELCSTVKSVLKS